MPNDIAPVLKPSASTELRQKGAWLKKAMETGQYYQDAELSLSALAEKLDIPSPRIIAHHQYRTKKKLQRFY